MFEKRSDLRKFLAVADTGKIFEAADKLGITQPALSRVVAKLEAQFGAQLFERIPTGVRLTSLGTLVSDLARHIVREIEAAEDRVNAAVSGRVGCFRITAGPVWMQAVLPAAIARFHDVCPGIELKLRTATRAEGIRLLASGGSDLHCGGIDTEEALPGYLRRERILSMSAGVVAHADHPLHAQRSSSADLVEYPWIDFDTPTEPAPADNCPSVNHVLDHLYEETRRRAATIIRSSSAGLFLMTTGPYLSWLSLTFLKSLPGFLLRPLPLELGTYTFRSGLIARRSAESMSPFRLLEEIIRDIALARGA